MKKKKLSATMEKFIAKYQYWLLGGGLIIGAVLRSFKLGTWSIWFDESFTSSVVRPDISSGLGVVVKDVHPPLYYLFLKGWSAIFGYSDIALRSFTVVTALVAAVLIYELLKRMFGKYTAAFAGFVVVLFGPFGVRYAQEARMYMLATIFIVIATWTFYNLMEKKKPSKADQILYALSTAGALYTHYFTFPVVFVHMLYAYIFHYKGAKPRVKGLKQLMREKKAWVYALIGSAILYLPWFPIALKQVRDVAGGFWIGSVTIIDPFYTFFFFLFNTSADRIEFENDKTAAMFAVTAAAAFLVTLLIVFIGVLWSAKTEVRRSLSLLALTTVVPVIVLFFISIEPLTSFYVHRYFIYFGMLWYGLLGVLLVVKYPRPLAWLRVPLIAFTIASFSIGLMNVYRLGNFNYNTWQTYGSKQLSQYVNDNYKPGDVILSNDIFTFYDAMHYDTTNAPIYSDDSKEYTAETPYLRQFPDQLVTNPSEISAERVWFMSLSGDDPRIADNWSQVGDPIYSEHAKLTLYEVE